MLCLILFWNFYINWISIWKYLSYYRSCSVISFKFKNDLIVLIFKEFCWYSNMRNRLLQFAMAYITVVVLVYVCQDSHEQYLLKQFLRLLTFGTELEFMNCRICFLLENHIFELQVICETLRYCRSLLFLLGYLGLLSILEMR